IFTGGVPRRAHTGSTSQRINLESRVIRQHDFSWNKAAVVYGLLAGIGLDCGPIFDHLGQRVETGDGLRLDTMLGSRRRKVAQLAAIGCSDENGLTCRQEL